MKFRRMHRRQDPPPIDGGISGPPTGFADTATVSIVESATALSSLLINPSATSFTDVPGGSTITVDPPLNPTDSDLSPEPSDSPEGEPTASGATSAARHISIGTVVGICVGVFVILTALLLIVLWIGRRSRRRAASGKGRKWSTLADSRDAHQNMERRKSGREFWAKMDNDRSHEESFEKFAMSQRSPDNTGHGGGGGGVARSTTMKSAKSSKTTRSMYGGGLGLANTFSTAEFPPQLEFTDQDMGKGHGVAMPRVKAPFTREHDPVSWDGETIANTSFLSLKSDHRLEGMESGAVSPSMVVSRQTPTAIELERPQWEAAEVISPVGDIAQNRQSRNPFLDPGQAYKHPFSDTAHGSSPSFGSTQSVYSTPSTTGSDNSRVIQSLLAALDFGASGGSGSGSAATGKPAARQSNLSSYSDGLGENFSKFPLPPSHTDRHH